MVSKYISLPMLEGGGRAKTQKPAADPYAASAKSENKPLPSPFRTGARTAARSRKSTAPTFESLFSDMLKRYMPETVSFEPMDEDTIRTMLIDWLRPAYEQAIVNRKEQTARYNAELDADAWARGMGESTYVTDVKERAFSDEARDVGNLESNYAATLAQNLFSAMQSQQEQKLKVDQFNAEQRNRARERALSAANALYAASKRHNGGSAKTTPSEQAKSTGTQSASTANTLKDVTNLIARLSPQVRSLLYAGQEAYANLYREIIERIGGDAFQKLMLQFPAEKE